MGRRAVAVVAILAGMSAAVGLSACTSDSGPSREDVISQLTQDGTLDEAQATCVVDGLDKEGVKYDTFNNISDKDLDEGDLSELQADPDFAKVQEIMLGCLGLGDLDTSPTTG